MLNCEDPSNYAERLLKDLSSGDAVRRIFVLMSPRRLKGDRFYHGLPTGPLHRGRRCNWVTDDTLVSVLLLRHFPELAPSLHKVENGFSPGSQSAADSDLIARFIHVSDPFRPRLRAKTHHRRLPSEIR